MSFFKDKFSLVGIAAFTVFALTACGKSTAEAPVLVGGQCYYDMYNYCHTVPGPGHMVPSVPGSTTSASTLACPAGMMALFTSCVYGTTLPEACYNRGGSLTTSPDGAQVCQLSSPKYSFNLLEKGSLSRLTPSSPSSVAPVLVGNTRSPILLQKNDLVEMTASSSGFWGNRLRNVFDCEDETDVTGNYNGIIGYHDGLPKGLVASDGVEVFMVGTGVQKTIANTGALRVGFNVPAGTGKCSRVDSISAKITRCVDASNVGHPCQ